jgi:hypothetical protein
MARILDRAQCLRQDKKRKLTVMELVTECVDVHIYSPLFAAGR